MITEVAVGITGLDSSSQQACGNLPVPTSDPRSARTLPSGCTAFLFDGQPNSLLSAGHCCGLFDFTQQREVIEFNVPLSDTDGTPNFPGPHDQYPVDDISVQCFWPGVAGICNDGNLDVCFFGVFANTETGMSPLNAQGAFYALAETVPPPDGRIRLRGYGRDDVDLQNNRTQQVDDGGILFSGPQQGLSYNASGPPGASGAGVEHVCKHLVYGIHNGFGCFPSPHGSAAGVDLPDLLSLIANPQGVCADCNDNNIEDGCDIDCAAPVCGSPCGSSADCNANGIPDECEPNDDCNSNGTRDICDIGAGLSNDCNRNWVPDECDLIGFYPNPPLSADLNLNGVPDECDFANGTSQDTNNDCIPDECGLPLGACCLQPANGCIDTGQACCTLPAGLWQEQGGITCEQLRFCPTQLRPIPGP